MAKKESTNEKIIRLFKEGVEIETISKDIGLTTENVKNIIESRIPNYLEYDPSKDKADEQPMPKEKHGFFGGKKKNKINLTMGKDGFVDTQAKSIAELLVKGKTYDEIDAIFNVSFNDIKQIDNFKETHFKRYFLSHPEKQTTLTVPPKPITNLPKTTSIDKNTKPDENNIDVTPELDLVKSNKPTQLQPVTVNESNMETTVETSAESTDDESVMKTTMENTNSNTSSANAFEKVKKFAQSQINQNIESLKAIDGEINDLKTRSQDIANTISNDKTKREVLIEQLNKINEQIEEIDTQIADNQKLYNDYCANLTDLNDQKSSLNEEIKQFKSMIEQY